MDLWVALAAAGAAYVAELWKNFNKEKENSSEFTIEDPKLLIPKSPTRTGHPIDKNCPFQRFARRLILGKDSSEQINSKEDVDSKSSGLSINDLSRVTAEELGPNDSMDEKSGNLCNEPRMTEIGSQYDSKKNFSSLRSRRSNLRMMKPLTSLDSCLLAQLCNEHVEMDEYVLSCFPSPFSPSVRPFTVTDGRRIIGSEGANSPSLHYDTMKNGLHKQVSLVENETVYGVFSLPYNMLEVQHRRYAKARGLCGGLSSSVARGKNFNSLAGSTNGALLFGLGVSAGFISSLLANKREVDKMNGLLKQTENLVQDLQDELEMKDSLTVKELPAEDFASQDTYYEPYDKRASLSFSSEQNLDGSTMNDEKRFYNQKGVEDLESMSKIEAELEAELERLELNMNSSSLERRLSDLVESDPSFVPGISQGELRPDMFGTQTSDQPYADQDGSGTSTPHPANYSVSPRELTLRLHEVIQARLEERVKELETALEISERRVRMLESEHKVVMRDHSDTESISSPAAIDERNLMNQPVIINLSGQTLDAYNEAYDALKVANECKESDPKGKAEDKDRGSNINQDRNGELNHYDEHVVGTSANALPRAEITLDWQTSSGDIDCSATESDSDDEFEKLLIKQIVEKNRRNSSVILNVERELFENRCEQ